MEKPFWTVVDENISFTETIISRIRKGPWYHPLFDDLYHWEFITTDEDDNGNEVITPYILNADRVEMPVDQFRDIIESHKAELWAGWRRVIFDD